MRTDAKRPRKKQAPPKPIFRRYCPKCGEFGVKPGADACLCGATPSPKYPNCVAVDPRDVPA
jgi:hypothetical protein